MHNFYNVVTVTLYDVALSTVSFLLAEESALQVQFSGIFPLFFFSASICSWQTTSFMGVWFR
jgi:hypothetical protein